MGLNRLPDSAPWAISAWAHLSLSEHSCAPGLHAGSTSRAHAAPGHDSSALEGALRLSNDSRGCAADLRASRKAHWHVISLYITLLNSEAASLRPRAALALGTAIILAWRTPAAAAVFD